MRNVTEPSVHGKVARNRFQTQDTRQKPHAFRWWTPECDETDSGDIAQGCIGNEPPLENGWAQPSLSSPLERFAFRLHADGSLEFKGHLDAAGAASGTVAVTLPGANVGEIDFKPANDQFFVTVITTDGGSTFQTAMVFLDSTTGEVTITFPAS